jgi:predicted ester cyclase
MSDDLVSSVLALWAAPPTDESKAEHAFHALYADPVEINGTAVRTRELVARAWGLHRTYSDISFEILNTIRTVDRVSMAYMMYGTHTGPLNTLLGEVPATGEPVALRTVELLTLAGGRINRVWAATDDLESLTALRAVSLVTG